ncbi:MAG: dTDP-4-dehydrorhamnose 3,5-epimerase [Parvicella sp.]|jgi:dTDP-4-dehydrorhamnose 3,5-epimerase
MYNDFKVEESKVFKEVKIITPDVFRDSRGCIYTSYIEDFFNSNPINLKFKHDKFAQNEKGVLRGIHGDFKSYKMVTCLHGEIFQVVVDYREESETFLKYQTFIMNHNEPKQILIPPGFGNAFLVLSDYALYNYKLSYEGQYNDFDQQFTIKWNDQRLNIPWPNKTPILSNRDQ